MFGITSVSRSITDANRNILQHDLGIMHIYICTGTHKDAMHLATRLRVPRQQWVYVATADMLMGARSGLVLVDPETINNHIMADVIAETISVLHARGSIVVATLAALPTIYFRN